MALESDFRRPAGTIGGVTCLSPSGERRVARVQRKRLLSRAQIVRYTLAAVTSTGLILSGCQSLGVDPGSLAQVRVIAASPDSPQMDFYLGGNALAYGVDFGSVSSYVPVSPGGVTVSANTANSRQMLVTANAGLAPGRQYTAVVTNVAASLQETVYADQNEPAPAGEIAMRIINAATRAGSVDIYLLPNSAKLTSTLPVRTGVSFGSSTGYILAPQGTYSLVVLPSGTVPTSTTQELLRAPQVTYAVGSAHTVVLVDHPNPSNSSAPGVDQIVADDYEPQ
jgi:hypothetical protein